MRCTRSYPRGRYINLLEASHHDPNVRYENNELGCNFPANTTHGPIVGPTLADRRWLRPNIGPTLRWCVVFAGNPLKYSFCSAFIIHSVGLHNHLEVIMWEACSGHFLLREIALTWGAIDAACGLLSKIYKTTSNLNDVTIIDSFLMNN